MKAVGTRASSLGSLKEPKYRSRKHSFAGIKFHSKAEALYAQELELRKKSATRIDRIKDWKAQVPVKLEVNGRLICRYVVDFVVEYENGRTEWVEVKGFRTPDGILKMKLFQALYPDRSYIVIESSSLTSGRKAPWRRRSV